MKNNIKTIVKFSLRELANIESMSPERFQDVLDYLKLCYNSIYNTVISRYFSEIKDLDRAAAESWLNDCDEVWDAEAYVQNLYDRKKIKFDGYIDNDKATTFKISYDDRHDETDDLVKHRIYMDNSEFEYGHDVMYEDNAD